MPATTYPASPRQVKFINDLRRERGIPALTDAEAGALTGGMSGTASREIDRLVAQPRVAVPAQPAGGRMLADLPLSKYAITEDGVMTFWVVAEFRGTRYMRLLVGAPGDFRRVKVGYDRARRVADAIRVDVHAAALAFAQHHTCCAVCGADLSDETSVRLGLGPICRQRFGL